jgi:hypothetical protein
MAAHPKEAASHAEMLELLATDYDLNFINLQLKAVDVITRSAWTDAASLQALRNIAKKLPNDPRGILALKCLHQIEADKAISKEVDELEDIVHRSGKNDDLAGLLARGQAAAAAQDVSTLAGRMRKKAIEDHIDEVIKAQDPQAKAMAAKRLKDQLDGAAQTASGQNAFSSRNGRIKDDYIHVGHWLAAVGLVFGLPSLLATISTPLAPAVVILAAASIMLWPLVKLTASESASLGAVVLGSMLLLSLPAPGEGFFLLGGFILAFTLAAMMVVLAQKFFKVLNPDLYHELRDLAPDSRPELTQRLLSRAKLRKTAIDYITLHPREGKDHSDRKSVV